MERDDDIMKCNHYIELISSLAIVGTLATTGCLELNKDHCVSKGGDEKCDKVGVMCTMSLGDKPEASADGCVEGDLADGFAYVQFGLPREMGNPNDIGRETVWGVLAECDVDDTKIDTVRVAYERLKEEVIDELDGKSRVRVGSVVFDKDVIHGFNNAIRDARRCDAATTDGTDSTTSLSDSSDGSTTSTTSGSESSTTGDGCTSNADCVDSGPPFCDMESGQCVWCSGMSDPGAACAEVNPMTPRCVDDECVGCTEAEVGICDQQFWACDYRTGACFSCAEHHQCTSGACDIFMGTCFDPATVVDVGGGDDGQATIADGLGELAMRWPDGLDSQRGVLVLHEGAGFDEAVDVGGMMGDPEAIAFMAAPGQSPSWARTMGAAATTLTIGAMTRGYLDGVALRGNADTVVGFGLACNGGRVDIRRSRIVGNAGGAIQTGGSCELRVENSFIGVDTAGVAAVNISAVDTATILYSTLAAGQGAYARALFCTSGASVEVRNSLLVARTTSPEVVCPSAVLTNSAWEAGGLGGMTIDWFQSYANGDYHLTAEAPHGIQAAVWQPGDPLTDIDGDLRVRTEGKLDYAGADVPALVPGMVQ